MTPASIRVHATLLAEAAIDAVKPESLLPRRLACRDGELLLDGTACAEIPRRGGRIAVVGGGKAAAGLAAAVERLLDAALAAATSRRHAAMGLARMKRTRVKRKPVPDFRH